MRVLRWMSRLFLFVLLVTIICYGILVLVNLKDEPLSPEAKAFMADATLVVPAEQNGYFAALGWRTAAKNDPYVTGWWLFEGEKDFASHNVRTHDFPDVLSVPDSTHLCDRKQADCLEKVSSERDVIRKIITDHAILLTRIRNLDTYPYFYTPRLVTRDPWRPIRIFEYSLLWRIGATVSAHAWQAGNYREAIATIAARIAVARRMLRDSGSVLDTALAVGWLRSEYLLISEILHRYPDAARTNMAALERLLTPLADEELRATRWIHGQFASLVEQYEATVRDHEARNLLLSPLFWNLGIEETESRERFRDKLPRAYAFSFNRLAPLFQPNATANLHYRVLSGFEKKARATRKEVGAMAFDKAHVFSKTQEISLFNPVGAAIAVVEPYEFLFRVHDIDRYIRLVAVQAALTKARVKSGEVEAFLGRFPSAIDPATGERMRWDVARSRVYVPAMAELWSRYSGGLGGQIGEISVPYKL